MVSARGFAGAKLAKTPRFWETSLMFFSVLHQIIIQNQGISDTGEKNAQVEKNLGPPRGGRASNLFPKTGRFLPETPSPRAQSCRRAQNPAVSDTRRTRVVPAPPPLR